MTDLHESLCRLLDAEPPLPDIAEQVIHAGRRGRRRRRGVVLASGGVGAVIATAVAVPVGLAAHGGGSGQSVAIAASPTASASASVTASAVPSASSATTAATGFGFDPSGPPPVCPRGQRPAVRADLSTVVAHGTYSAAPGQSWTGGYLKPDPDVQAVGFTVASVNGTRTTPATAAVWVVSGAQVNHFTTSVLLVRSSSSTWVAHPARFTGCASA
jgi:hypothetical protein